MKYLYRAVDRAGHTIDFLLRAHWNLAAARRFFERAIEGIRSNSGANIELRQSKYLNNIVEQDHRAIKRIVRPMLGLKRFRCARPDCRDQVDAHDQEGSAQGL